MFNLKYLIRRFKLNDVFTPTSIAKLTYIQRFDIEKDFEKYINLPGMQIVIYGHSGSGKTTLVDNMLMKLGRTSIKTCCTETMTYNQLLLDAFDRLGSYYTSEKTERSEKSRYGEIASKYKSIAATIQTKESREQGIKETRIIPIQLTSQRLADFLGESNYIWVIEDFHKVKPEEKRKLSQILKVFMDASSNYPSVKIICIGAVGTARELIQYDKELTNRIAELFVPLMSPDELDRIIRIGFGLMNIDKNNTEVLSKITHYSNNLASVCHHLCYDICYNNGIKKTSLLQRTINEQDFIDAVKSFLAQNSDTFSKIYEKACSISRCKDLLQEIIERNDNSFDPGIDTEGKNIDNEQKRLDRKEIMDMLSKQDYGEIFRINSDSKKYVFSSPFFQTYLKMKYAIEKSEKELKEKRKDFELHQVVRNENMFLKYWNLMENKIDYETILEASFRLDDEIIYEKYPDRLATVIKTGYQNKKDIRNKNRELRNRTHNYYKKR